jgi:transaldolase
MAAYELGCDHVTVLPASIKDLLSHTQMPSYRTGERDNRISDLDKPNLAYSDWIIPEPTASARRLAQLAKVDPLGPKMQADLKFASTHIDYLADGVLDEIIAQDEVTRFRLDDAVAAFKAAEEKLFAHIANVRTSLV